MLPWFAARQLERTDRYVQRCLVRVGGEMSRTRIAFSIEEALRLISLPGESAGRVYCFREVSVGNLSTRASRQAWTDAFQAVFEGLASHAIHGSDHRADSANAVFFRNHQEALEILLGRLLLRNPADQWFWPQVTGTGSESSRADKFLAILERLHEPARFMVGRG